ncbi:putative toxin-antitoxin system toxin component, PIN family [Subsaximicrobium wynnwilliamsii]|uniref:Putative toxin-antitoxin system toxin component, PIN family n=1 Tax=Subsaximicrobium wynnwilliamsii TaxID=291179 RepID=A0A5C6ZHD0_9FLAO|nr:putative toxin-antitoxin system toxin component, PIN family [Subsaximicrobium wynnwilliamsii]TXD83186.1 putative toxin-antitoxin system toxin component, PIN family [Subsaximicrobium wynnwilliamsii]TXD88299.1 putative toxin-antitoxin system toxin component, PIN family [Subsaximicrobium wynnwilliamsii]TXE03020.1 putative toxin-antitoxin system toxin component, PIN family [Subsaximicrobium wynnwilliamsii]
MAIIDRIERNSITIIPEISITACRDPKDNKFLELAVAAKASCIITGDDDLLVLHPFRSIPIFNPSDFLSSF